MDDLRQLDFSNSAASDTAHTCNDNSTIGIERMYFSVAFSVYTLQSL